MALHCCGFCCRSFSTWWAIMGQHEDFKEIQDLDHCYKQHCTHTHLLRHHSLELPCVYYVCLSAMYILSSIRKFWTIVLVSNRIEYWSNYSIRFEILNIRTALQEMYNLWCRCVEPVAAAVEAPLCRPWTRVHPAPRRSIDDDVMSTRHCQRSSAHQCSVLLNHCS